MKPLQYICFYIIVAAFLFGMSDRLLSHDLSSLGIAAIFFTLLIPLFPAFKS